MLKKYPGLFTDVEIHSLDNLRGIPKNINSELHLSKIRKSWNGFYKQIDQGITPLTRQAFINQRNYIDSLFGSLFLPPL